MTRAGAGRLPGDHAALSASHEVPSPRRAERRWPCSRRVNAKQAPLDPALGQGVPPGPRGQGLATLLTAPGQGSSKQLLGRRGMGGQAKRAEPPGQRSASRGLKSHSQGGSGAPKYVDLLQGAGPTCHTVQEALSQVPNPQLALDSGLSPRPCLPAREGLRAELGHFLQDWPFPRRGHSLAAQSAMPRTQGVRGVWLQQLLRARVGGHVRQLLWGWG